VFAGIKTTNILFLSENGKSTVGLLPFWRFAGGLSSVLTKVDLP
jgi:hypothetical protein